MVAVGRSGRQKRGRHEATACTCHRRRDDLARTGCGHRTGPSEGTWAERPDPVQSHEERRQRGYLHGEPRREPSPPVLPRVLRLPPLVTGREPGRFALLSGSTGLRYGSGHRERGKRYVPRPHDARPEPLHGLLDLVAGLQAPGVRGPREHRSEPERHLHDPYVRWAGSQEGHLDPRRR